MAKKTDSSAVKVGEFLAMHNYYVVTRVDSDCIHCTDANGQAVKIGNAIVDEAMTSTTQYATEKKVTRTELAAMMAQLGHAAFSVTFRKQVSPTTVADGIDATELASASATKRRRIIKDLMAGEQRVMHCRLWRGVEDDVEMELGRYKVVDLETSKPGKPAQRLVDTRTVSELIVEGTRYYVK